MTTDMKKEREAFEAAYAPIFVSNNVANMPRRQSGEYVAPQQQIAWMMWQARAALAAPAAPQPTGKQDLQVAAPQCAPSFNARHVSLSQPGTKIILTLELDAIEGAPQYIVTPVNPAVVRQAAPQGQPSDASQIAPHWMGEHDVVLKDRAFKQLCALLSRYSAAPQGGEDVQPVAWVRRHPDGALTAEFLEDAVIEPSRKNSGAWVPLYATPQPAGRDEPAVPKGWKFRVTHEDDRTWLAITTPHGACAALSTARKDGNGNEPIASQVLSYLGDALTTQGARRD